THPGALQLLEHDREGLRRDGQVERRVARDAVRIPELVEGLCEPVKRRVVVERAADELDVARAARPHLLAPRGTGMVLRGFTGQVLEVAVAPVPPGEAERHEARRQQATVGQVVNGRDQLLLGQVTGDAEDDQRAGRRDPGEPPVLRVAQRVRRAAHDLSRAATASRSRAIPADRSVRCSRTTGRPRPASACRSPAACAACSWPNVNGVPGTGRSSVTAPVICRKTPFCGPPLWYCPVEGRNRGPQPKVTRRPQARARAGRIPAIAASPMRSRYAITARYPCGSIRRSNVARVSGSGAPVSE